MRYWVYGADLTTKDPRDPLIIEAASEEAARAQAKDLGMAVEEIEAVQPLAAVDVAPSDYPLASALVHIFRLLAGLSALLSALAVVSALTEVQLPYKSSMFSASGFVAVLNALLQGVVIVSLLLAAAEGLRLAIAIERNTRKRERLGSEVKTHRRRT